MQQIIKECLSSRLETKGNKIIKSIIFQTEEELNIQRPYYEKEIELQKEYASLSQPPIALMILDYQFKEKENQLEIKYDCDKSCTPILEYTKTIDFQTKLGISLQILEICSILVKSKFPHRNIKPSNLLYYDKKVLLTDFGSNRTFQKNYVEKFNSKAEIEWQQNFYYYNCGNYLNVLQKAEHLREDEWKKILNEKDQLQLQWADTWALGIIILEIFSEKQSKLNKLELYYGLNESELSRQLSLLERNNQPIIATALRNLLIQKESPSDVHGFLLEKYGNILFDNRSQKFQMQPKTHEQECNELNLRLTRQFAPQIIQYVLLSKQNLYQIPLEKINTDEVKIDLKLQTQPQSNRDQNQMGSTIFNFDENLKDSIKEALSQLLSVLKGKNYWLCEFLHSQVKISYLLDFEKQKQLNKVESDEYLQELLKLRTIYKDLIKTATEARKITNIKNLVKIKRNIYMIKCRIRAINATNNQMEYPEPQIIYYLNLSEVMDLKNQNIPLFNNAKQEIERYLRLFNKVESYDYSIEDLSFMSIKQLEALKKEKENQFRFAASLIEDELIKKNALGQKYHIEQYPFDDPLFARNNYDNFVKGNKNSLKYKLTINQLNMIHTELQINYKRKLLEFANIAQNRNESLEPYMEAIYEIHEKLEYTTENGCILYRYAFLGGDWLKSKDSLINSQKLKKCFREKFQPELRLSIQCWRLMAIFENRQYEYKLENQSYGVGLRYQDSTIQYGVFFLDQLFYGQIFWNQGDCIAEYNGFFRQGRKQGQGLMKIFQRNQQGEFQVILQYEGEFNDGEKNGIGVQREWNRGRIYKIYRGSFVNNQKTYGIEEPHPNNVTNFFGYEGPFDYNLYHGEQGKLYLNEEKTRYSEGTFQRGKRIGTHQIFENNIQIREEVFYIVCGKESQSNCQVM